MTASSNHSMQPSDSKVNRRKKRPVHLNVVDYRSVFDNMAEGFSLNAIVYDESGKPCDFRILEVNPAFERSTGLTRERTVGRLASEVQPGLEPFWIEAFGQVVLTGQPVQIDNHTKTLNRDYRVYAYRPAPGQFAAIFMDITNNRQTELQLNSVAEKYRTLFNTTSDGVCIHNLNGEILEVNDAYCQLSGYTRQELTHMTISMLDASENPAHIAEYIKKLFTQGGHDRYESQHRRKDGSLFVVDITSLCIDQNDGRIAIFVRDITERKQAEEHLAYLASFPECNPNPIIEVDLQGKIHYANPAILRLFPDLIERGPEHPWLMELEAAINRFHQNQDQIIVRDIAIGNRFYQQSLNYISPERLIRIYGLEITRRKQAEAALQESEQMLNRAQEIAHLGSWELDLTKNRLTWSNEVYRIFGFQPQEFAATYEAFLEAVHPDDRAAVDEAYSGSIKDGHDSYEVEHRLIKRSTGEVRIVHEKCVHFRDETGKVIRSEGMVHDITDKKLSEEALRLSEEKYRTMVETSAEGIALAQPDGTFLYVNHQMANMLGYTVDEILGKKGSDFMYENQAPLVQQLRNELHRGDILHGEFHFRRKDGSELWSMYNASPIFSVNGEHISNLVMHTDITEHKRADQALRKAYDELELRVQERTQELNYANSQLRAEIIERQKIQTNLESSLQELQVIEEELRNNNEMLLNAQKVLDAERQRYQDLFDFAPDAYLVTDKDGKIIEANQFAAELLRITHQHLIGKPLIVFISQVDHEAFMRLLSTMNRQRLIQSHELRLIPRHRPEITASVKVALAEEQGKTYTLRWTIRDISHRKRAEDLIRQNSVRNAVLSEVSQSLAEASLDEQAILDIVVKTTARLVGDGCVITLASENGQRLDPTAWHHRRPDVIQKMDALFANSHRSSSSGPTGQVYQTSQSLLIQTTAGTEKSANLSPEDREFIEQTGVTSLLIVPLKIGGLTIGTIGLGRDLGGEPYTKDDQALLEMLASRTSQSIHNARLYQELQNALRQELETHDQLVQAEKFAVVGRLLASITHEINNPLQTIKNCLYLSQIDTLKGTPVYDALNIAVAETNRLSNLVAQLREIYRPPSQGQSHPVDLLALVSETRTLLSGYLQDKHITWQVTPPDAGLLDQYKVEGVADQLKQVFLNIGLNAIDAMEPTGGSLLIDFKLPADDNQVGICFRDRGPGLPPEVEAKLFEPFTTTKEKGLGLGLVICYDIIQKHHGHIEVESEPGKGAAFTIWLPAKKETV